MQCVVRYVDRNPLIYFCKKLISSLTSSSRSAGTWLFDHRRWLDPCNLEDLEHLRQVSLMRSTYGRLYFVFDSVDWASSAGLLSPEGPQPAIVQLQRGAVSPHRRRDAGKSSRVLDFHPCPSMSSSCCRTFLASMMNLDSQLPRAAFPIQRDTFRRRRNRHQSA